MKCAQFIRDEQKRLLGIDSIVDRITEEIYERVQKDPSTNVHYIRASHQHTKELIECLVELGFQAREEDNRIKVTWE